MKKYKILIVEDDQAFADITGIKFPSDYFTIKTVYNGMDALEEVNNDRPDLIVLDIIMPKMDGWEVLSTLKSDPKTSSIPVIMATANNTLSDVEKSFTYGAQSYIEKPFTFDKLLKKVAVILNIQNLLND